MTQKRTGFVTFMTARLISGTWQNPALAQAAVDLMRRGATFPSSRISSCTANHWMNRKFRSAQFWLGIAEVTPGRRDQQVHPASIRQFDGLGAGLGLADRNVCQRHGSIQPFRRPHPAYPQAWGY